VLFLTLTPHCKNIYFGRGRPTRVAMSVAMSAPLITLNGVGDTSIVERGRRKGHPNGGLTNDSFVARRVRKWFPPNKKTGFEGAFFSGQIVSWEERVIDSDGKALERPLFCVRCVRRGTRDKVYMKSLLCTCVPVLFEFSNFLRTGVAGVCLRVRGFGDSTAYMYLAIPDKASQVWLQEGKNTFFGLWFPGNLSATPLACLWRQTSGRRHLDSTC
jgi:hypothetical protein